MNPVVVYGSRYGNARRYAEALAEKHDLPVRSYEEAGNLTEYDTIIYIGSLYAGRVVGLSKTMKRKDCGDKKIFILTVGLADGENEKNIRNIEGHVRKQVPEKIFERMKLFHLRGGIDYQKLSFVHRQMMKALCKYLRRTPPEKRDEDTRHILETYGGRADLSDLGRLDKIWEEISSY